MSVRSAQVVTDDFTTANPSTMAAANADSLPTGTLVLNGTDNAAAVTVTNVTTGVYKFAVTMPTLAVGDLVCVRIAATVAGVAGVGIVWRETCDMALDGSGRVDLSKLAGTALASATAGYMPSDLWRIQSATFLADAAVPIDLTQLIGSSQTDGTVGSALLGLEAETLGKWVLDITAKTLTKYRADGTTLVVRFDLDSATAPLVRTPQ